MRSFVGVIGFALLLGRVHAADPAALQLFERKIRPVLVEHCYRCHSSESTKLRGGLRVDSRAALLKGGDTGPALIPNKPKESLLVQALRGDGLTMPPKGRLPDETIADFERWIRLGAPDPRDGTTVTAPAAIDVEKGRSFWAFQPSRRRNSPRVKETGWARSPLDDFLLAQLEERKLRPVAAAERGVLVRRIYLDLIGLPPTPEEIEEALSDKSPDWYEKLIERLLASAHFGERWGRHWLDVARFADSNGKDENYVFHEAFRYRDYVVSSFNRDKPFDRFVREQLAGDLLPAMTQAERDEQLTGTGFLVVGPKVLADRDKERRLMDVVDEQIDTVGKAFLGLTVGCARCHNHKFDPIPTQDYYALAGIFKSTRTIHGSRDNPVIADWMVRPLGADGEKLMAAYQGHLKKATDLGNRLKKAKADLKMHEDRAAMRVPATLVGFTVDDKDAKFTGEWKKSTFTKPYVGEGYLHDDKAGKGQKTATYTPKLPRAGEYEVYLSYTTGPTRATNVPVTIHHASGEAKLSVNQQEKPKLDGLFRSLGKFRFEAGTSSRVQIGNQGTEGHVIVDAVRFVPVGALANVPEMAMGVPTELKQQLTTAQEEVKKLEVEEAALKKATPPTPPLVLAVRDEDKVEDCRVNVRGNPHALGASVPRGWLQVAATNPRRELAPGQSGRRELAEWIASPENPLTARVFVNRVWQHLFGEGLVRSVDNFGVQGERPTHPELLDELAARFMAEGWSVKALIREIVLSRTYQLGAIRDHTLVQADPENRWLGRANRRRVEAEVLRDSILFSAGSLDRALGGPSTTGLGERAVTNDSKGGAQVDGITRRSLYLPVIRNEVPQVLEVFDFADPDVSTGRRDATTVATQALFLLNSPFVLEQSRQFARLLLAAPAEDRLSLLYRRALSRTPNADESKKATEFVAQYRLTVKNKAEAELEAWAALCQAVFASTEFHFVE